MTPEILADVSAQIVSFIALVLIVASYFVSKKNYLLLQTLGMVGLLVSFLLKANFFAMVGTGVSIARAVTFFVYEKFGKRAPVHLSFLFASLTVAAYLVVNVWIQGTAKPVDILYLVSLVCYAFTFRIRDRRTLLYVTLVPTAFGLAYTIASFTTVFVLISYAFELSANIVALGKMHIENRKNIKRERLSGCDKI